MRASVQLTSRDIEILQYLKEQGFATSEQLRYEFFPTMESFYKRMVMLKREGLLESVPLKAGASFVPSRMLLAKREALKSGKRFHQIKLYKLGPDLLKSGTGASIIEPIFWQHQLGLNDVRAHLKVHLKDGLFLSDPELKREWARFNFGEEVPIPDLVWRKDDIQIAVEFERTSKGERRYLSRMLKYNRSKYNRILYVAENDSIGDLLKSCTVRLDKIGVTTKTSLNKVFSHSFGHISLNDFLKI